MSRFSRGRRRVIRPAVKVVTRWLEAPSEPDLESLYRWWTAMDGGRDLGMTPETVLRLIRPFQQQALVTEVIGDGFDFKSAIVGSQWVNWHGRDVTNSLLSHYRDKEVQTKTRALFNRVVVENRPLFVETPPIAARRVPRNITTQMMFLPVRRLDGSVSHFITALPRHQLQYSGRGSA